MKNRGKLNSNPENWSKTRKLWTKCVYFFTADTKGMTHYDDPVSAYQARPKMWIVNLIFVILFAVVLFFMGKDIGIQHVFDRPISWSLIGQRLHDFFTPDWEYFFGYGEYSFAHEEGVVYGCLVTLGITIVGTAFGFIISLPFGFLASYRLFGKWSWITTIVLILIRTFPELLLALFFINLSGATWLTAILCLSIHSIGMMGKLYSDQLDENDFDALEALDAEGASKTQRVLKAVIPDVAPSFISVGLYRLDINLRTATTLGLVLQSSAGIGYAILLDLSKNDYHNLGADTLGIILMIILVDCFSSWLRKKIV